MSGVPMLTVWSPPAPAGQPYENPNVWNVPGTDPNGPAGDPKVGSQNWCWANIGNQGTAAATNVSVQFYYCTPNTPVAQWSDFLGNSAGQVTLPTLAAGAVNQKVCATTPWTPPNTGHVCLIAYVEATNDPGPPQTPTLAPQITDRHVAQNNMAAVTVAAGATLDHEFLAHSDEGAMLTVRMDAPASWSRAGAAQYEAEADAGTYQPVHFGLVDPRSLTAGEGALPVTRMEVQGSQILALRMQVPDDARPGERALFRIESTRAGQTLSGLSVMATVAPPPSAETMSEE